MKPLLLAALSAVIFFTVSCGKLVDKKKEDLFFDAVTKGRWHVEKYLDNNNNITEQFDGYDFQFYKNGVVQGYKLEEISDGTWEGDLSSYSIISNFPGSSDPVRKLNGTWKIKDTDDGFVNAEMETELGKMILHLRRNPQ